MINLSIIRIAGRLLSITALAMCASTPADADSNAQALAGDWEYVISGPIKMQLHLKTGADGALTGTIDTTESPPKHYELSNVQLSGKVLKYTMPPLGTIMEVVQPDGNSMVGSQAWQRVSLALSARDAAGDWENAGKSTQLLHLRLDPNGLLIGYLEDTKNGAQRQDLESAGVLGTTLTYKLHGNVVHGAFSNDRKTIVTGGGNPTWQRLRTFDQALAYEEAHKVALPTDGSWSGVINPVSWSELVKVPPKGEFRYVVRLGGAPLGCWTRLEIPTEGEHTYEEMPCRMKNDGGAVTIEGRASGTFTGTLRGNQITGTWTATNRGYFLAFTDAPMKLTLMRDTAATGAH